MAKKILVEEASSEVVSTPVGFEDVTIRDTSFFTPFKRIRQQSEYNRGELITEQAGYIPPQRQIEGMIAAGVRLEEFRKSQSFDFNEGDQIDEDFEDVTRRPGFDPADASQMQHSLRAKSLAAKKTQDRLSREKAEKESEKKNGKEEKNGGTEKNVGSDTVSGD